MNKQKLKIGLFLEDYNVENWFYNLIEEILKSDCLEIVLIINEQSSKAKHKLKSLKKTWNYINQIFFNLYSVLEKKRRKNSFNVFQIKNVKNLLRCEEILLSKNSKLSALTIEKEEIQQIKSKQLDVIICAQYNKLTIQILTATKNGVWYFKHGNYNVETNKLSGVWETFKKDYNTKVSLNVINENIKSEMAIYETAFNTDHLFIWRNRQNVFWKSKSIMKRKLDELHELGSELFFQKLTPQVITNENKGKLFKAPNNFETLKYVSKLYFFATNKVIKRQFYFNQWVLLYSLDENDKIDRAFKNFKRLLPPKDRFWADPFIIKKEDKYFIYIEELIYKENRGKISVIEMDSDGNYSKPEVVLETDYHLSYPFLIEDSGELYMLPETQENKTIELYKCVEFPNKWKLEKILFQNIKAVDSTIIKYNDKYWLFTNLTEYNGEHLINELCLFYSDNLLGDSWTNHPHNPISTDHTYSRPAGNIFMHENKLLRPSQNCSKHYGYGIQMQEIVKLTETEYQEKNIESIYPNWDIDLLSTHTFNTMDNLTFIDAKISRKK